MKLRASVLALLLLASCSNGFTEQPPPTDAGTDAPIAEAEWRPILEELDGALLSVWGSSSKDVWSVGGPLGNEGFESLVVRFDGTKWRRLHPGKFESFWWVHGTGPNDVWMVGEKGRITHWDGTNFREDVSGTTATLFGVYAFAANDVWAVGGTPEGGGPNDVVLHFDGTAWTPETLPAPANVALFKVWGTTPGELYVVGENAVILRRTGGAWRREGEGVGQARLTTVFGCSPQEVYAVGGRDLLSSDGSGTWKKEPIEPKLVLNDLNGVSCNNGVVFVAGAGSVKLRKTPTMPWTTDFGKPPLKDLHAAWVDETGALWGAGGQFTASARPNVRRSGVLARYAKDVIPTTLE